MAQANAWGLNGAYIQWGKRGPNTTGDSRVDWVNAVNNGTLGFAAAPTGANANSAAIAGWSTTNAADFSWRTAGGAKTTNDPCPSGYRVPTKTEWVGVKNNNTASTSGLAWTESVTNYNSAQHFGPNASTKLLTLPAAGIHVWVDGSLGERGRIGYYWSSTELSTNVYFMLFNSTTVVPDNPANRQNGMPVRCIAE
jgi:uncharacterized protein (TIGR02145 family)